MLKGRPGQWFTEHNHPFGQENNPFGAFSIKVTEKLHEEQTEFQLIEIYQTEFFGKLMVFDGYIMLTERDNYLYHEMIVHPALFTHPNPKNVVIIGGGDCGTLKEVARHPNIQTITQIEIDQRVTELSQQFFPELCEANNDPRVELVFDDGIAWINSAEDNSIDIIIIDSTDPIGAAIGLFTPEFYADCIKKLSDSGLLVQQSESPFYNLDFIQKIQKDLKAIGFNDVRALSFPQPTYPSGYWTATMACKNLVTTEYRIEAAINKAFPTKYYNADIHQAALAQPEFMKNS